MERYIRTFPFSDPSQILDVFLSPVLGCCRMGRLASVEPQEGHLALSVSFCLASASHIRSADDITVQAGTGLALPVDMRSGCHPGSGCGTQCAAELGPDSYAGGAGAGFVQLCAFLLPPPSTQRGLARGQRISIVASRAGRQCHCAAGLWLLYG